MEKGRITAIAVDDEINTRKLLQVLLDWSALGIEFIGEASNGNEALDLIEVLKPNIVFTDINMPYMDGLELARLAKEKDPFIKIVILTAYPEFEYAKQGVKFKVHDFLLKPIQPDVLRKLALDLKDVIEKETSHWNEYRKMKTELLENTFEMKGKFLLDLLVGTSNLAQLNKRYEYFFGESFAASCSVAVLDVFPDGEVDEEQKLILSMGCKKIVEIIVQEREGVSLFHDYGGRVVIIGWNNEIELGMIGEQAIRVIKDKMGYQTTVGVGNSYYELNRLRESYKEALEALRYGNLYGGGQVISFGEDIRLVDDPKDLKLTEMEEVIFYIRTGLKDEAKRSIDNLFLSLASTRGATIEQAYSLGVHFISLLTFAMSELGITKIRPDLLGGAPITGQFNRIFECKTFSELSVLLSKLAEEISVYIHGKRTQKKGSIIDEVLTYLMEDFCNPELTLGFVSQRFHLNSSYLSRIFKQEIGQSFTDYLLKLRIDEAVKLMNETEWKAYQIADKVGIKDPYYFSHRFKKVTGVSIQEYKRNSKK
ncbi:Regulator of RpoS [Paenibacillus auburnensis]|uniref:Regulator of RpoS n=1 Tax=Paenibacillus auburnensis TaxID=2905649 RepID=A0ABM9C9S2_9BACL|nr:response regulator [Paenibacillus auburnensis]CAH1207987.1 Regulator of RpoS [Paenibacillus auburnensis]